MHFKHDISFLRVVAVFSVLLFHFNFPFSDGGFIGVDVFFVISGYLMTSIIINQYQTHTFNLLSFYKRRVLRIIPALLVMLVVFAFVVFIFVSPQFIEYVRSAYSSSFFFSNIYYYYNSGYFDQAAKYNFLLHTWSLSVEWQFYMIYPLVLLIFKKVFFRNRNRFVVLFICLILLSITLMVFANRYAANLAFYMVYARAWEMMFGGLAFFCEPRLKSLPILWKKILVFFSFLILALFFTFKGMDQFTWPSKLTIFPIVATSTIIALNLDIKLFNNKLIHYLGNISYSLYLYHWPLYVLSLYLGYNLSITHRLYFIFLSFIFAVFFYELIERRKVFGTIKITIVSTIILWAGFFVISKLDANIYSQTYGNLINLVSNYKLSETQHRQYNFAEKHLTVEKPFTNTAHLMLKNNGKPNVVLLGDSHAGMFAQTLDELAEENNFNVVQITADATYPMENSKGNFKFPIEYFNFIFRDFFPKNFKNLDLVIINSNYLGYDKTDIEIKINNSKAFCKKYNLPVVFLGVTPSYFIDFPTLFYIQRKYNYLPPQQIEMNKNVSNFNSFLKSKLQNQYIDLLNYPVKRASVLNYTYMHDTNHLTEYGATQYKGIIRENIHRFLAK